jgi:hypothetical protein
MKQLLYQPILKLIILFNFIIIRLTEVLEIIKKSKLDESVRYLTLTLSCYDSENNDVDVPLVKYKLF